LSVVRDLGWFHSLPIVNRAVINMGMQIFSCILIYAPSNICLREWQSHKVGLFIVFEEPPYLFPQWLSYFTFPPILYECSFSSQVLASICYCLFSWWRPIWLGWVGILL
jgi:hypothetical protein